MTHARCDRVLAQSPAFIPRLEAQGVDPDMSRMPPEDRVEMERRNRRYFEAHFERDRLIGDLEPVLHEVVDRGVTG